MKVLLKQARIVSPSSPHHGSLKDILVVDGFIRQIDDNIAVDADMLISNDQLHVSTGWMDLFAHFGDPGFEHKETLGSGAAAAAAGGFTDVMLVPDTSPPVSSKTQVEYLVQKAASLPVNIHPIGAITKNLEGKQLAEMYDMHASGAIAFSDGTQPVQSPGILLKALQYVLAIDACIIQVPDDKSISAHGLMNEGISSTRLGLPGKPAIAEELMIARDIELLQYTQSRLHVTGVSTAKSMELILEARKRGLKISCSCTPYHLLFCDEDLAGYDTNLKVNPPLRSRDNMMAIREGLKQGWIDCVASHHMPQHWDDKTCEFEYAKEGMIGLESLFGAVLSAGIPLNRLVEMLTVVPRTLFGMPQPTLEEGQLASLTLFDPTASYIFDKSMIRSTSANSAFIGKELKGKVIGIINKTKTIIRE